MNDIVKSGYLNKYSDSLIGAKWKRHYVELLRDSTIRWFENQGDRTPKHSIILKHVAAFLAFGEIINQLPSKPDVPASNFSQLLAVPHEAHRKTQITFFMAQTGDEARQWTDAIISTLPPPPQNQGGPPGPPGQQQTSGPPPFSHINPMPTPMGGGPGLYDGPPPPYQQSMGSAPPPMGFNVGGMPGPFPPGPGGYGPPPTSGPVISGLPSYPPPTRPVYATPNYAQQAGYNYPPPVQGAFPQQRPTYPQQQAAYPQQRPAYPQQQAAYPGYQQPVMQGYGGAPGYPQQIGQPPQQVVYVSEKKKKNKGMRNAAVGLAAGAAGAYVMSQAMHPYGGYGYGGYGYGYGHHMGWGWGGSWSSLSSFGSCGSFGSFGSFD